MVVFLSSFNIKATKTHDLFLDCCPTACHSIFPLHLPATLLLFGVHCCCVHCTAYLLCQQFALIICKSMHGNHVKKPSCRHHARTHTITFNECDIHEATHSIYFFFFNPSWKAFLFCIALKQPHQRQCFPVDQIHISYVGTKIACSHFLCGLTYSVHFYIESSQLFLSIFLSLSLFSNFWRHIAIVYFWLAAAPQFWLIAWKVLSGRFQLHIDSVLCVTPALQTILKWIRHWICWFEIFPRKALASHQHIFSRK